MTGARTQNRRPSGFTLMELIVVMAAIALLLAVAVPSFSAMMASQRRSLAQTQLQAALAGARTLALQQFRGTDTAAVFTFEPGGQVTIVACVQVGSIADVDDLSTYPAAGDPSLTVDRDVFVPDGSVQPVTLPNGWMVRGLITAGDATAQWYSNAPTSRSSWVFPETGFYDQEAQDDGDDRQTFMIRFEGGTGRVMADTTESLVLLRRPSTLNRVGLELGLFNAEDPARFIRLRLADPDFVRYDYSQSEARAYLLGNISSDTVLTKPAWALAVYREREMAIALDLRIVDTTGSLYEEPVAPTFAPTPITNFDPVDAANWLETQDLTEGTAFREAVPGGLLFALNRADGSLVNLVEDAPRVEARDP